MSRLRSVAAAVLASVVAVAVVRAPAAEERAPARSAFDLIVLGDAGGLDEANLTAFLLFPAGGDAGIALDAGTLHAGIRTALASGALAGLPLKDDAPLGPAGQVLQRHVKAYLISHAHLDHVAGLILGSTDDAPKPILARPETLAVLREHVFNWRLWPNFATEGTPPALARYTLTPLASGVPHAIPDTSFRVTAFPLSHGGAGGSTAFLVETDGQSLLYLGDTGPDAVEGQGRLRALWTRVAPLVRARSLRAILIEASFPSDRADDQLHGHLTPRWVNAELGVLAALVDPAAPEHAARPSRGRHPREAHPRAGGERARPDRARAPSVEPPRRALRDGDAGREAAALSRLPGLRACHVGPFAASVRFARDLVEDDMVRIGLVILCLAVAACGSSSAGSSPLAQTRFVLPDDATPNEGRPIGPFCCSGRTLTVTTDDGTVAGYAYFFDWEGQARQVSDEVSAFPNLHVLLSGREDPTDPGSAQVTSSVLVPAGTRWIGKDFETTVGGLRYRIRVTEAEVVQLADILYFLGEPLSVALEVDVIR